MYIFRSYIFQIYLINGGALLHIMLHTRRRDYITDFEIWMFVQFISIIRGAIKIFATNLTYRRPELSEAPWFVEVDMSKYIAKLIDALNYDESLGVLVNPAQRIMNLIYRRNCGEKI